MARSKKRENEAISVIADSRAGHPSRLAAMENRQNEAISVIAIGRAMHPCRSAPRGIRPNEADVNLDHLCRVAGNTITNRRSAPNRRASGSRHFGGRVGP